MPNIVIFSCKYVKNITHILNGNIIAHKIISMIYKINAIIKIKGIPIKYKNIILPPLSYIHNLYIFV